MAMTKTEALEIIKNYGYSCDDKVCENCTECVYRQFNEAIKTIETLLREVD